MRPINDPIIPNMIIFDIDDIVNTYLKLISVQLAILQNIDLNGNANAIAKNGLAKPAILKNIAIKMPIKAPLAHVFI